MQQLHTASVRTTKQLSLLDSFDHSDKIKDSLIQELKRELLNIKWLRYQLSYRLPEEPWANDLYSDYFTAMSILGALIDDLTNGKEKKENLISEKTILNAYETLSLSTHRKSLPKIESRLKRTLFVFRGILDRDEGDRQKMEALIKIFNYWQHVI